MQNWLYLLLSVSLSAVRNITSKKTAVDTEDNGQFYFSQTMLFSAAVVLLFLIDTSSLRNVSSLTLLYGAIYGVLLVLSQWMYTFSLKYGNTSVCTIVYSLGFVFPTLSGAIFWGEDFTVLNIIGLILALIIILLTVKKDEGEKNTSKFFIFSVILAMLASGGLGIMQKVQQSSAVADEQNAFMLIAFSLAAVCSLCAFLISGRKVKVSGRIVIYPAITGMCFGGINQFNTILAGRMNSAVFFPVRNIATILLSTILGIAIFKEKLTLKNTMIIILSVIAVLIFSF